MKKAIDVLGGVTGCKAGHVEINHLLKNQINVKTLGKEYHRSQTYKI